MFGIIEDGTYQVDRSGFTVPTLPSTGYIVAIRAIHREADIPTEGTLFGRWTDHICHGDDMCDNIIYWDEVEVIQDRTQALRTAWERQERAVWDLSTNSEVRIDQYGSPNIAA